MKNKVWNKLKEEKNPPSMFNESKLWNIFYLFNEHGLHLNSPNVVVLFAIES
jgi:hypothetical protein